MLTGAQMQTIWRNNQIFMCQVACRGHVLSPAVTLSSVYFGLACHVTLLLSCQLYWLYLVQKCCSWNAARLLIPAGSCWSPTSGPTWTCSDSTSPSLQLHIHYNDLTVVLMSVLYILVIFIQCKWKLTNCFAMIVWVMISFLMLTLLLSIGPNTSTLSVRSVLWWAYLIMFCWFNF